MTGLSRAAQAIAECRLLASFTEEPGHTTRRFLTPPVIEVHAHLRQRMEALGMSVSTDAAGNLRGLWQPAATTRRIAIGSHIDTVPNAGAFDGILGVVLALALVEEAQASKLPLAIEVIAFSEEEGVRFGVPFIGSRAVAGRFDPALFDLTDSEGISLRQAILNFGLPPTLLDPALFDQTQLDNSTIGFFEIHIEQGPVLEAENRSLAAVSAIVGQSRYELLFTGHANHAGTTPMHLRHDALAAAAEWIVAVEKLALLTEGLIATVGKLFAEPNAGNVIAGSVRASLDLRSARDSIRTHSLDELLAQAQAIATRRGLQCKAESRMEQPAVPMDEQWTALLAESLEAAGHPPLTMSSGAGHDAMVMATRVPTTMLFLRSPGGISHHPNETVLEADVEAAIYAASLFLRRLAARIE